VTQADPGSLVGCDGDTCPTSGGEGADAGFGRTKGRLVPTVRSARQDRDAVPARRVRRPVLAELVVVVVLLRVYDAARAHADVSRDDALRHARSILDVERRLHLDPEHAANAALHRHERLCTLAVDWYQYLHIPVTMALLLTLWVRCPARYRPLRTSLVLLNVVGLGVFLAWPLAPPRLLSGSGFIDSVSSTGHLLASGSVSLDQYGAMPSLHIAWAVWSAVVVAVLLERHRLRHLAWLYPATTAVVVIATANHYLVDVAAGAVLALGVLRLVLGTEQRCPVPAQRRSTENGVAGSASGRPATRDPGRSRPRQAVDRPARAGLRSRRGSGG
jgi:hypothetical protein